MLGLNLAGKNILVTGTGRGLGRAIAIALAKHGSKVFALSRTPSTLDSLVKEQPSIEPIVADVSCWEETRCKLEDLKTMDGLVNNAGIFTTDPATMVTKEKIYKVLDTNLLGVINCAQVVANRMIKDGRPGSIVNMSGTTSLSCAGVGFLPYAMSKGGLDAATRQLAFERGPYNIRVNSVNPALVKTTNSSAQIIEENPKLVEQMEFKTPLKRLIEVDDVTGPVVYFLSDLSSMVTATCNVIDGGILNCMV
ncbi:D-erythrulose reductase-like [Mercenaria mercenaria]|uniref:D-erythrulose reductase-like n=1 Tax=Mercenaria mercenaria TaxID=6596 RepID=UPI00234E75FC|nr:D-erythrulose reductase-like [Mercenaria mercenaria]